MLAKKQAAHPLNFLAPTLKEQLNSKHELYLLSKAIHWDYFEHEFSPLYSPQGRPAHPIRLMVSLLILQSMYNLSGEALVEPHWEMNVYFQYFSGVQVQRWGQPCAASDLVHFRKRIRQAGVEKILQHLDCAAWSNSANPAREHRQHGTGEEYYLPYRCQIAQENHRPLRKKRHASKA